MIAAVANLAWLATQSRAARRFRHQLRAPVATQEQVLRELLQRNAGSAFGKQHGFADIRTPADFAARIPLATYGDLEPWIHRIMRGEQSVLTCDPVTHLVPTSGSSGARKLIPFTAQLQREFNYAIAPWITDLYGRHPSVIFGPAYWSISPVSKSDQLENSTVPIGFDDDTSYLAGNRRRLAAAVMAAPSALRDAPDMETFFLLTLVCLLRRQDLRLISVWHPSFLLLLLDALPRHWETIITTLRTGRLPDSLTLPIHMEQALELKAQPARAREIQQFGPSQPHRFWPGLTILSCWTDAHASLSAAALARRFPGVTLQPKGLIATEAFVTLPHNGMHPVAVGSHYFEFIDETGAIQSVASLQLDHKYEVVVTTGGGLWRYRLGDRVQVTGFVGRTPSLIFIGRAGHVSDLFGEKLTGEFVTGVITELSHRSLSPVRFAMLAPDSEPTSGVYTLFWEGATPPSATDLDRLLGANPQYAWCRQLGQLRPAQVFAINSGAEAAFLRRATLAGQKLGEIKPPTLVLTTDWAPYLRGLFTGGGGVKA